MVATGSLSDNNHANVTLSTFAPFIALPAAPPFCADKVVAGRLGATSFEDGFASLLWHDRRVGLQLGAAAVLVSRIPVVPDVRLGRGCVVVVVS